MSPVTPDTEVRVVAGSLELTTWQSYQIELDLRRPANAFSLVAPNTDAEQVGNLARGQSVQVYVDDEIQMTGYIDDLSWQADASGARVEISGRDVFGQLMDCSAPLKSYKNTTLLRVALDLASTWVPSWTASGVTLSTIPRVKIEPGESVMDVLVRLAQVDGALVWGTPDGAGMIGRPTYTGPALYQLFRYAGSDPNRQKNNIISGGLTQSNAERYTSLTLYGTSGNTKSNYGVSSAYSYTSRNSDVVPTRSLIVTDGDVKSRQVAQDKADLDQDRREFDSEAWEYQVRGHYGELADEAGNVSQTMWDIDTLVGVEDTYTGTSEDLYVIRRRFSGSAQGRYTDLELRRRGIWLP